MYIQCIDVHNYNDNSSHDNIYDKTSVMMRICSVFHHRFLDWSVSETMRHHKTLHMRHLPASSVVFPWRWYDVTGFAGRKQQHRGCIG